MSRYAIVKIEQLDYSGEVWRTFTLHPLQHNVGECIDDVRRGYNMERTRVSVCREAGEPYEVAD